MFMKVRIEGKMKIYMCLCPGKLREVNAKNSLLPELIWLFFISDLIICLDSSFIYLLEKEPRATDRRKLGK